MAKKKMGRPPKLPEDKLTARLEIRLTAEELALIEDAASGKTSTWVRDVAVKAAKRLKKTT